LKALAKSQFDASRSKDKNEDDFNGETDQGNQELIGPIHFVSESYYAWVLRCNLGNEVDVEILPSSSELQWTLKSFALLKNEIESFQIFKFVPKDVAFELYFDFSTDIQVTTYTTNLPGDCLIEQMDRQDHDTQLGYIVEVIIPRRKKIKTLMFKAQRYTNGHLSDPKVITTVPLSQLSNVVAVTTTLKK